MKVGLIVKSAGANEGKVIRIAVPQFIIGRDPQCQLRPSSAAISKRHCAVLVAEGKVLIRDFNSTNGTFVNDEQVQGDRELKAGDRLKVGPLDFVVQIEAEAPAAPKPAAAPAPKPAAAPAAPAGTDEADIAAMLLLDDGDGSSSGSSGEGAIPEGSTVMDLNALATGTNTPKKDEKPKGNTSKAAEDILKKYMRRRG
jgi:pSer/pThr/pTyr-binding forkhead associated (FHA) protein